MSPLIRQHRYALAVTLRRLIAQPFSSIANFLVIMLALSYLGSTELLTPARVLLYQLAWMIPSLLATEWTRVV